MGIYIDGDESLTKVFLPVAEVLKTSGAGILHATDETGADLIPLKFRGVPTFSPIQDTRKYFDYHHTAADTLDKVDLRETPLGTLWRESRCGLAAQK